MVTYNPKDWIKLIVHFHKSDTMRILMPAILLLGCITFVVSYIEQHYLQGYLPANLSVFHQISGFIISLVLVFRINSAYDRWWEGRKLWGSLLNHSRNLAIKLHAVIPREDKYSRVKVQFLISNFAISLKEHLRGSSGEHALRFADDFSREDYLNSAHKPNFIARELTAFLMEYYRARRLTPADYLIINSNLNELTDICGACERIKNTPIPYSYSIFIKKIIFIYVITMPFTFGLSMSYWSVFIVMLMFYAFASMELISEEIEDPFGTDDNDLPTNDIAEKIRLNTTEILLS